MTDLNFGVISRRNVDIIQKIGRGSYGDVYICSHKTRGNLMAVKMFTNQIQPKRGFLRERSIYNLIRNPILPRGSPIIEFVQYLAEGLWSDEQIHFSYIGMSLLGENLETAMYYQGARFTIVGIREVMRCVSKALIYLHNCHIIHGDIKLNNICYDKNSRSLKSVRLIDFSNSNLVGSMHERLAALINRAPEVILKLDYDCKLDIWALGCIAWEMFDAKSIFKGARSELELLNVLQDIMGPMPKHVIGDSPVWPHFADLGEGNQYVLKKPTISAEHPPMPKLNFSFWEKCLAEPASRADLILRKQFLELVRCRLLVVDQKFRASSNVLLNTPFLKEY